MTIAALSASDERFLLDADPTFDAGQAQHGRIPKGFTRFQISRVLRRQDFAGAAADLLGWRMHARAGLRVAASDDPARLGSVVLMGLGPGRAALRLPCRVVEVVQEDNRQGFAYVTLPGHPECGIEWFVVERDRDGSLRLTITAISRPASLSARLAGPLGEALQHRMTLRYMRAMDQLA